MPFCTNCGSVVADGAAFCVSCGSPTAPTAQTGFQPGQPDQCGQVNQQQDSTVQHGSQPFQQAYQQPTESYRQPGTSACQQAQPAQQYQQQQQYQYQPQVASTAAVSDPKYRSLGGWLLFFVVMEALGALGNFSTFFNLLGRMGSLSQFGLSGIALFDAVQSLLLAGLAVGFIVLVVKRNPIFLRYYQIITIVALVLAIIQVALAAGILNDTSSAIASTLGGAVGGLIGGALALWLMTMYYCKSVRVRTYMESTEYIDRALFKVGA